MQNRRALLTEEIFKIAEAKGNETVNITSMASGPARELADVYEQLEQKERLKATLIDIDAQALDFVAQEAKKGQFLDHIRLVNANLIFLAIGRKKIELNPQDLIYNVGLIDYFSDKYAIRLINYAYQLLRPGGKLILGNFHPKNQTKAFMGYVLEWPLTHRTEEDMNRLFETSDFSKPCTNIRFEEQGINLFAECTK